MNGYRITEARQDDLAAIVDIYNSTIDSRLATADLRPATVESSMPTAATARSTS